MVDKPRLWEFILKDGSSHFAYFTDAEIREREKKYPEVEWIWNH